jgi:hypothetical protein
MAASMTTLERFAVRLIVSAYVLAWLAAVGASDLQRGRA